MSRRPRDGGAMSRPRLAGLGAAVTIMAVALASFLGAVRPASAQGGSSLAEVEIEIVGGIPWDAFVPVNARVGVAAERAVSGVLIVTDRPEGRSTTTYEFDIDLAAGSRVELPVTLSTSWNGVEATAVLRSGDQVLADDEVRRSGDGESVSGAVAVLGVDDPPLRVPEQGGDRQLATVGLDDSLRGLDRANSLVAPPSAIGDLGEATTERLAVDAWIRGGGQLVVDGPSRSLDDSYHGFPTANPDRFAYGAGSIVYDEDWRDGVPLGGYEGATGLAQLVESQGLGAGAAGELAILANVALPAVGLIAAVLLLYALVAGPVLFTVAGVKRAHRRIWSVLPALSLVVAAGVLGVGLLGRRSRSEAHITIVEVGENGSRVTSNLLLSSSFGGDRRMATPDGWNYLGQGRTSGTRPVRLRVGRTNTDIAIDMPPGSSAVVRLAGVSDRYDAMVTIDDIRAVGATGLTAQVTNHSDADLREAVAFLGAEREKIGDIPAGETVEISIDRTDLSGRTMQELLIWPRVDTQWVGDGQVAVPRDRDAEVAAGAWTEWRIAQGLSAVPENVLGVAAWTDDLAGPVAGIDEGRTALFVRANVADDVHGPTGFRLTGRLPNRQVEPIFQNNFAGYPEDYRLTLEPGADLDRLAVHLDAISSALAFEIDGAWRYAALPADGEAEVAIPAAAVVDGEVTIRSLVPDWSWGSGNTVQVVVDGDEVRPPELADEFEPRMGAPEEQFGRFGPGPGFIEGELVELDELTPGEPTVVNGQLDVNLSSTVLFPAQEGQNLVATLQGDGDPYLELLSEGNLVASNDDDGGDLNSLIAVEIPADGLYELRLQAASGPMEYELTLEVEE